MCKHCVIFSRATSKESFSIKYDEISGVAVEDLKEIGWSESYYERSNFENLLQEQAEKHRLALLNKYCNCITTVPHQHLRGGGVRGVDTMV